MKKSLEMKNKLEGLKQEAQNLLDQNKVKEAQDKMEEVKNLKAAIIVQEDLEKEEISKALNKFKHYKKDKELVAKSLGISRATLYRKLEKYNLISK